MLPPVIDAETPAVSVMDAASPLVLPVLTLTEAEERTDAPLLNNTLPDAADAACPLLIVLTPLPALPSAVATTISPLFETSDSPDFKDIDPPVDVLDPALATKSLDLVTATVMSALALLAPLPDAIFKSPVFSLSIVFRITEPVDDVESAELN